jgi:hypothetical protein
MATRSRIGIENENGTISSIYCHFDGYPDGVGKTLKEHYTDRNKIQSLIDLGNISILGENEIETVAYHRDRGEEKNEARVDNSLEAFSRSDYEKYGYVYTKEGKWVTFR